jgi:hypothetical protein
MWCARFLTECASLETPQATRRFSKNESYVRKRLESAAALPEAPSPLLARRGGRDTKKNIAKLPLMERTGWWFNFDKYLSILIHHPVSGR